MTTLEQVRQFHDAFGVVNNDTPSINNSTVNRLRVSLNDEENRELEKALADRDKVAALDALIDLQYVLDGAFLALGFADVKEAAFAEVHRSNMSKLGADGKPIKRADGKVLKGPGYTPPNLSQFIK